MWSANPPRPSATELATSAASTTKMLGLGERVSLSLLELEHNSAHYQGLVHSGAAALCLDAGYTTGVVTGDELKWLYKNHVADSTRGAARELYNEIKQRGPRNGVCPYCNQRQADTVDHFVPKTTVPQLAIEPWNLVPACMSCNRIMLDAFSKNPGEQYLHPYANPFPIGPGMRWLRAEVVPGNPVVVRFTAEPDVSCEPVLAQRIVYEFNTLHLATLYATVSIKKINAASNRFIRDSFSADSARDHLEDLACTVGGSDVNDWEAVLYRTLAASDWYVGGGYWPAAPSDP